MSPTERLSEKEFKEEVVRWLMKYDRTFFRKEGYELDDYVHEYRLPDFDYVHVDSFIDDNGDVLTYLRGELIIDRIRSRSCTKQKLIFYHTIRTFIDSPEVEPYPMGYTIVAYEEDKY